MNAASPTKGRMLKRRSNLQKIAPHLRVLGGYILLTVVVTYPLALHLTTHVPFSPYAQDWSRGVGDQWYFLWASWLVKHLLLASHQWPLVTDAIFYPRGVDLTASTLLGSGISLLASVPLAHFLGLILSYNLLVLGSFVLSGYSAFLLARHVIKDGRAAFVAGVIFAFCPYHMARALAHFNFAVSGLWIPLYVLCLIRAVQRGHRLDVVLASIVFASAGASNAYYAIALAFMTGIYFLYHLFLPGTGILRKLLCKRLLSIAGLAAILLLPLAWLALTYAGSNVGIYPSLAEANYYSGDLLAFFIPNPYHPFWKSLVEPVYKRFAGNVMEQSIYVGYTVLALAGIAVVHVPKRATRFWSCAALLFFTLALGPFLHVLGQYAVIIDQITVAQPLPYLLLHLTPVLGAGRVPSRFAVMLMLVLALLAGYGVRYLVRTIRDRGKSVPLYLVLIVALILVEFWSAPLPIIDARVPSVYASIAQESKQVGTLLEVPLRFDSLVYQYYQTTHGKRLIAGGVPRLLLSVNTLYADTVPLIKLFKHPDLIGDYEQQAVLRRDVLRFIEFFDLDFIVLHKDYLDAEVYGRLLRFLQAYFPVRHIEAQDSIVALYLAREDGDTALWLEPDGYRVDFGATAPQFFISEGWSVAENWAGLTGAWSDAEASRLWVFFPRLQDLAMELRLLPFTFPGSPPQGIKIYVNERFVTEIELGVSEWRSYTVHLPQRYLTRGHNMLRFAYRYAASPVQVLPDNHDPRTLAVAFDYIAFRPQ